ncbi:MAG TPA: hypothetical protein VFG58_07530 [Solirubrobacterales bacterium]|nr:hypothetical protein [Solirubrobacterales bacterium]
MGALVCVAVSMLWAAGYAEAAPATIAEGGQGAGRVLFPVGAAVDQSSGDLYVADRNNFRINKFDQDGNFLLSWGYGVRDGHSVALQTCGPEASPPTSRCFKGEDVNVLTGAATVAPSSVAVDQTSGDVYVSDTGTGNDRVSEFGPAGEFIRAFGGDAVSSGPGNTGADEQQKAVVKGSGGTFPLTATTGLGFGRKTAGSNVITEVTSTVGALHVGDLVSGSGIPGNTPVTAVGSDSIALAAPASSTGAISLTAKETTSGIPYNASEAEVEAALEALPGVGTGNVGVARTEVSATQFEYLVSFSGGPLHGNDIAQMTSSTAGLTGSPKAATISTVVQGGGPEICVAAAGDVCKQGDTGSAAGQFGSGAPGALAFDVATGNLWVGDVNRVQQFEPSGAFVSQAAVPSGGGLAASLAIDPVSEDFYLKSASFPQVRRYEPSGSPVSTLTEVGTLDGSGSPRTVAVDALGNAYVGDATSPYRFKAYDLSGAQISQFGAGQVIGAPGGTAGGNAIAIGEGAGALYAVSSKTSAAESAVQAFDLPQPGPLPEEQHVEDLEPTTATLAATLNPEGNATTYHFEYDTNPYGEGEGAHGTPVPIPDASLSATEFDAEAVAAPITGLIPGTTYHFRLVASNECEPSTTCTVAGPDTTFTTLPAISIDAQWASGIGARSVALHAELNPLGVSGRWWLEYGTSPCSEGGCAKAAEGQLPASFGDVSVGAVLTGLEPATTYYYRFAASDKREAVEYEVAGADHHFTTQLGALGFSLADGRAWEMVSPPEKFGALLAPAYSGQIQAAADGNGLAYLSFGSVEAAPEGNRLTEESSALARRGAGGAWSSTDITPPNADVVNVATGFGGEYKLFSPDLSGALLEPRSNTLLSVEASERTPYLRTNGASPSYRPLLTGKEGYADVPPGTEFGTDPTEPSFYPLSAAGVQGATPDLSHVVLQSAVPLVEGTPAAFSLYEWVGGQLSAVSIEPEESEPVRGQLGSSGASTRHAISDDGSRIFWSSGAGGTPTGLYVRDMPRNESVRLDDAEKFGGFGTGPVAPIFQGANSGGTVAFFTDTQNLSPDANEDGADLYRWQAEGSGSCETAGGCLTDVTAHTENFGESAEVQGLVAGMSDDASKVYLVAKGVLAANAVENGAGPEAASPGEPNLYLWQQGVGTRFLATLSEEDFHDWGETNTGCCFTAQQSATASPSGRYLAFMSQNSLTGYDNRDATSGELDQEVFRYDASGNEGAGSLACASCNPSGTRPRGLRGHESGVVLAVDPKNLWGKGSGGVPPATPLAATLPEATQIGASGPSLYRPRTVLDNGRLFFNGADSLVGADSNGNWDVYEYEPTGVGSCTASTTGAAVARSAGGCVALISSGTGEAEAAFLDASESGDDAFFLSSAQLSVLDEDHARDIYDARVGGIPATRAPRAECLGEACQPAASPPTAQTPASSAFEGPGNLVEGRDCGAAGRRAAKLSRSAKKLRRHARMARRNGKARLAHRRAAKAKGLARRARKQSAGAKRCRRARRRAGR